MTDSVPILFALLIVIGFFLYAKSQGVVTILSSGVALIISAAAFLLVMKYLPSLASGFANIDFEWKTAAALAGGIAVVVLIVVRLIAGWVFKAMLGQDGPLHMMVDGIGGGILSLIPSLAVILFLFTCIRIAGTLHELNYAASLSRDEAAEMGGKIPPYPWTGRWRNSVESIPFVAMGLDWVDPFSNRRNRNAAAFVTMNQSSLLRSYLLSQPDSAELAEAKSLIDLNREPKIHRAVEDHDRVALVLDPNIRETAADPGVSWKLRDLDLRPLLEGYVKSLNPNSPPRAN